MVAAAKDGSITTTLGKNIVDFAITATLYSLFIEFTVTAPLVLGIVNCAIATGLSGNIVY